VSYLEKMRKECTFDVHMHNIGRDADREIAELKAKIERLNDFPVLVRKMWSGDEVKKWIKDMCDV
jgi:predicted CopG family antitoxin